MGLTVEFTVEPFVAGEPGPHVQAAIEAARRSGLAVDVGPFGTSVRVTTTGCSTPSTPSCAPPSPPAAAGVAQLARRGA